MLEIWKSVVGHEGLYEVSNLGNIRSLTRKVKNGNSFITCKGLVLSKTLSSHGYEKVNLYRDGKSLSRKVHRLVAISFIPNTYNKRTVNHKNGIKIDNNVENLEWNTHKENIVHGFKNGLYNPKAGHENQMAKMVVKVNVLSNESIEIFGSIGDAEKETGIARTSISHVCRGVRKTAGGFKWKFI